MTNTQIPDEWQLDSGLREDMVMSIHSAYFAPHADYQDGHVLMLWLLGTDENEDPVEVRMSVGADWETSDGNTIQHPTKKKQIINKNSIYGHWISHCFDIPELSKTLIERGQKLGAGPRDARIWIDLILHLELRELVFGRNIAAQERLMPTEYLGMVDDAPIQAAAQVPTTPPAVSPADLVAQARAAHAAPAVTNGSPLYSRAIQLAKTSPNFEAFVTAALGDAEILQDEELAVQCADEAIIWTAAHSTT